MKNLEKILKVKMNKKYPSFFICKKMVAKEAANKEAAEDPPLIT